jgi:hypothetical protein
MAFKTPARLLVLRMKAQQDFWWRVSLIESVSISLMHLPATAIHIFTNPHIYITYISDARFREVQPTGRQIRLQPHPSLAPPMRRLLLRADSDG